MGRNLAVLVEAAVRNHILQLRGYNSTDEFMQRQRVEIEKDAARSAPPVPKQA